MSEMLAGDAVTSLPLRLLTSEIPKLEEAIRLLRLLATPEGPEEAVEPGRIVSDAVALARLYPDLEGVTFTVEAHSAPPVLVRPVALTHDILLALIRAAQDHLCSRGNGDTSDVARDAVVGLGPPVSLDEGGGRNSTLGGNVTVTLRVAGNEVIIRAGRYSVPACMLVAGR